jgi:cytochrome c peroxidase
MQAAQDEHEPGCALGGFVFATLAVPFATRLEDAIRHHLDVRKSNLTYDPRKAGVPEDLRTVGPSDPVLAQLDPILQTPIDLTEGEFKQLVAFVRDALLDERARPKNLCKLVPAEVPSGLPILQFQACHTDREMDR